MHHLLEAAIRRTCGLDLELPQSLNFPPDEKALGFGNGRLECRQDNAMEGQRAWMLGVAS
jgi:hypothetical protein